MRLSLKELSLGLTIGLFSAAVIIMGMIYITADVLPEPVIPLPPILHSATSVVTLKAQPLSLTTIPAPTAILTNTPPPFPTATSTPTSMPVSTDGPVTATLTVIEQMLADGDLVFTGPLTSDQQILLYETSLQFIAPTTKQAHQVGDTINGLGYGSPSLICGPLSLAILQNAGLIEYNDVAPRDFWLLNPSIGKARALLNRVFPPGKYENKLFQIPLNKFDWSANPLEPGDFLYIRHGSWGNFDHMLVVSRVDGIGRRYAVTNFNTPDGFIIDEAILYDPNDPKVGLFHTWTERPHSVQGATGFGGFESWRRKP